MMRKKLRSGEGSKTVKVNLSAGEFAILDRMVARAKRDAHRPECHNRSTVIRDLVFCSQDASAAKFELLREGNQDVAGGIHRPETEERET